MEEEFEALIPYNTFLTEQKRSYKKDIRHVSNCHMMNKRMNTTVQITVRFYLSVTRPVRIKMDSHVTLKFMNVRIVRIAH